MRRADSFGLWSRLGPGLGLRSGVRFSLTTMIRGRIGITVKVRTKVRVTKRVRVSTRVRIRVRIRASVSLLCNIQEPDGSDDHLRLITRAFLIVRSL